MAIPLCLGVQKIRDPLESPMWPNFEVSTKWSNEMYQQSMQNICGTLWGFV